MSPVEGVTYSGRHVRKEDKVFFPVVDVIGALTDSKDPVGYWSDMKRRESIGGIELLAICRQLKVQASNGKAYKMDCVDIEGVFRLVQSIPSAKAEPIKLQLARIAYERVQEEANPELGINRARLRAIASWRRKGYSDVWIAERLAGIEVRHGYTDSLQKMGADDPATFAAGTAIAHTASFGLSPRAHKGLKRLRKSDSLRDNMVQTELAMAKFSESLFSDMVKFSEGQDLDEVQEKHASMMKSIRLQAETTVGRKIATPETPLKRKELT